MNGHEITVTRETDYKIVGEGASATLCRAREDKYLTWCMCGYQARRATDTDRAAIRLAQSHLRSKMRHEIA